jgi:Holliday junction resolvase RusA-like endonuclease
VSKISVAGELSTTATTSIVLETFTFTVPGEPVAQARHRDARVPSRGGGYRTIRYTPEAVTIYRDRVLRCARQASGFPSQPWPGHVRLTLDAFWPRPKYMLAAKYPPSPIPKDTKPDIDNLTKAILDALTPPRLKRRTGNKTIDDILRKERIAGHLVLDDGQVHIDRADRWYAGIGEEPRVVVTFTHSQRGVGGLA